MGLNRLLSLSKSSVLPEIKAVNAKGSKIAVKTNPDREIRKEKCKINENSADISTQKIDKTLKNGKSATTTKKSMLWNTLRITNKNKSCVKKEHNRMVGPTPANGSPRSSIRSNHSSKPTTPPPNGSARNGTIIIDSLNGLSKTKTKELENNNSSKIVNKNNSNAAAGKMQQQIIQQLVEQQSIEKQKMMAEMLHASKGVEALGVLVQYLVYNLDAFSCPSVKKAQKTTIKQLLETRCNLDEMKSTYQSLEDKLNEREIYFNKRESDLQEFHRCEVAKVKKALEDLESEKQVKVESLKKELASKQAAAEEKLQEALKSADQRFHAQELQLLAAKERENDLLVRVQKLTVTEDELREKVHSSELEFSEKLHLASLRERDMAEKITQLTKQLDEMRCKSDDEKRELEEKLNLTQDELLIMRQTHNPNTSGNESFHNKTINLNRSQLLSEEVESLRCVLELKQREISDLRKQNCELQRAADDSLAAQAKCSALESRVEDLQVQLGARHEEEKELVHKLKQMQDQHDSIQKKSSRLSLHNEELQWRLKQNAERYSHTINELSKSYHEQSSFMCNRSMDFDASSGKSNGSIVECDDDNDGISPPASPIIKGVVEKSDSVSWVLEMDDETPEVLANRMVRRAGSFRSDKCSPSPVPKRQKCQNNTSIQQSASATSILRQHSEPSPNKSTPNPRLRSKSVSANKVEPQPKKIVRSTSNNGSKNNDVAAWSSVMTSSPRHKQGSIGDELIIDEELGKGDFFLDEGAALIAEEVPFTRSRTSTFESYEAFHRETAPEFKKSRENRGLITCDTASLATGEKKSRRPKLAAGEAMISGSNSEDEEEEISASTSSTVSTGPSTPSISSNSSTSSSNQQPIESIEDALLRWKSNGPMEVSWCDDGEPSESNV